MNPIDWIDRNYEKAQPFLVLGIIVCTSIATWAFTTLNHLKP